jgi:hypothetical protein
MLANIQTIIFEKIIINQYQFAESDLKDVMEIVSEMAWRMLSSGYSEESYFLFEGNNYGYNRIS